MNYPRRRARELALKALYQAEMTKSSKQDSINDVLSNSFYDAIFRPLGGEFVKDTAIPQVLAGDVEEFIFDITRELSASPLKGAPESIAELVDAVLERHFKGILSEPTAKADIEALRKKAEEKYTNNAPAEVFARELIESVSSHCSEADDFIARYAKNWSIDRISVIDKCILRLSICELFYFESIPVRATLNEAVELAKRFSAEKSHEFINGILDRISKENKITKASINRESIKKSADGTQGGSLEAEAK